MILRDIKVEHADKRTGLVLKKITTSEWEHLNHKIAVNNSLFSCEQKRLICDKPLLNNPFQINHIPFKRKKNFLDYSYNIQNF